MQFKAISLVVCAVFAVAAAEIYLEEKFTEGKFIDNIFSDDLFWFFFMVPHTPHRHIVRCDNVVFEWLHIISRMEFHLNAKNKTNKNI